jgi:putative nucleotidyltransferase with HDIG domain
MLWEHSFGAGLAARIIAAKTRLANEEEAFLAGLFHDIGKTIMNSLDRDKFQLVMQKCYNDGIPFDEAEKSVYPFSHDEVGAYVIKKWNFPDALFTTIMQHHKLEFTPADDDYLIKLTAVVNLADQFCRKLGIGTRDPEEALLPAQSKAAELANLSEVQVTELLDTFSEAYEKDRQAFA